jgi:hypothetical protein
MPRPPQMAPHGGPLQQPPHGGPSPHLNPNFIANMEKVETFFFF